jgi:Ca2+-transporting ATPase
LSDENELQVMLGKDLKNNDELSKQDQENILQIPIFSRVTPQQKLDLITVHQNNGSIVAMTGDGVNDAPALKKADIGIAMGRRGSQVAMEAADMILKDDAFETIVSAVEHGRIIFNNIRKFIVFLLSGNVGEILAVVIASLLNAPLPILPLQILFINLLLDVFPALALGMGQGTADILHKPPRNSKEPILTKSHWFQISGYGILISITIVTALLIALLYLNMSQAQAVTISFLTLGFARLWHVFNMRLWHVFNMRDTDSPIFKNEVTRNPFIWGAILICTSMLFATVYISQLANILSVIPPDDTGWTVIGVMSLIPLITIQIFKIIKRKII